MKAKEIKTNNFSPTCKTSALNSSKEEVAKKPETNIEGNSNKIESNILKSKNNSPCLTSSKLENDKKATNEMMTFESNSEGISKPKQIKEEQKTPEEKKKINSPLNSSSKEKETKKQRTNVDILIKEYGRRTEKYIQTVIKVTKKSLQI